MQPAPITDKKKTSPQKSDSIFIKGARTHNLKNVDVAFPTNKFIVVTGVSGSGKSSLTIDTLFAEGQRRYAESLSPDSKDNHLFDFALQKNYTFIVSDDNELLSFTV